MKQKRKPSFALFDRIAFGPLPGPDCRISDWQRLSAEVAVCELSHTHARTFALYAPLTDAPDEGGCHMQTRHDESPAPGWPWAPDVTRALVCLMVGLLLLLASVTVPA